MRVCADKQTNLEKAADFMRQAKAGGADVVMLPECFNSPYGIQHFPNYAEEETNSETLSFLKPLVQELQIYLVAGSIPESSEGKIYNTCYCLSEEGEVVAKHRKAHLFDMDIPGKFSFFESSVLTAGDSPTLFETKFGTIGVGICYDIRFPEYAQCIAKNSIMIVYPGCFPIISGEKHQLLLQKARSVDNQVFSALCSQARDPDTEFQIYGHSAIMSPWAEVLTEADENEGVHIQEIDLGIIANMRQNLPYISKKRPELYAKLE